MRILPLLLLAVSLSASAEDQPYLVRDLPGTTVNDSMPYSRVFWATTGNTTWFAAATASKSLEVFKTDGTTAGTVQVTHGNGVPEARFVGPFLGMVAGKLVYGGRDAGGEGVFALDTNGGDPVLLGRFALAYLTNGAVRGDTLYFSARANSEHELWRTDGTSEGTSKIDLLPGEKGAFDPARDTQLFSLGQWMFFYGVTAQGTGLHRTDGTSANTTLVLPLSGTALYNDTAEVSSLGDRLLFSIRDHANLSLWATDGTQSGTSQIATVSTFEPLGVVGGKLFFDGGGVWATDGTAAGTRRADVLANTDATIDGGLAVGNHLFLFADAFEDGHRIRKLYVTEGTAETTRAVMTVDQRFTVVGEGFAIGNDFYFRHDDGVHGMELWRTDGTAAELFADINPGSREGVDWAYAFKRPDGKLLFIAKEFNTGREPWITDGTPAGTHLLKNCAEEDSLHGSSPHLFRAVGNRLFYVAQLTAGQAIGVSDGTSAGTAATLLDYPNTVQSAAAAHGRYFFSVTAGLYATDGTPDGSTPLYEHAVTLQGMSNGVLFNDARDLWFSDGTAGGTRKLRAFGPSSWGLGIAPFGALAWVSQGPRLWTTDGTEAGTVEITPAPPPSGEVSQFIRSGSLTYFIESTSFDHGYRLWRSDGTSAGTMIVKDLEPPELTEFVGATERLVYFEINDKLYRSDGTDSGTIALPVTFPCVASAAVLGDALLFTSYTSSNATLALWRSDGTAAGTMQLAAMRVPRDGTTGCRPVTTRGNAVYFSGWDAAHGWELWVSDGTAAGTKMLADIYPGAKSSLPAELTVAGDHLFFSADSPNIGRELWALGAHPTVRRRAARP